MKKSKNVMNNMRLPIIDEFYGDPKIMIEGKVIKGQYRDCHNCVTGERVIIYTTKGRYQKCHECDLEEFDIDYYFGEWERERVFLNWLHKEPKLLDCYTDLKELFIFRDVEVEGV
mgnify:FL=1